MFEKLMSKQLSTKIIFENILSEFQCEFRKRYTAQHCLLLLLMHETWKIVVDNNEAFGALLTNLSKLQLSYDLLIAKFYPYGLLLTSLRLQSDYFIKLQTTNKS